jgi:hypothetical protein
LVNPIAARLASFGDALCRTGKHLFLAVADGLCLGAVKHRAETD